MTPYDLYNIKRVQSGTKFPPLKPLVFYIRYCLEISK